MSTELKPCPFCGARPHLTVRPDNAEATTYFAAVGCYCGGYSACAHKMATAPEADKAEALACAAWNRRALSAQPPADLWQYRWTNPGDQASLYPDDMAWKEVKPSTNPHMQTLEQRIEELRAFRYNGKPTYEVRPLYAGSQPPAPSVPPVRERLTETQIDSASPLRIESAHWFKLGARWAERALIGGEG